MAEIFQLGQKVALITGSMSGVGLETAKLFLNENLKGLILLDIVQDDSILSELRSISKDTEVLYRKCDVSDAKDLAEAYDYAWHSFGYIHLAVHSAGIAHEDDSRRIINVNAAGTIDGSMWLWNKMRNNAGGKGGTIINISSVTGILGKAQLPIYSATKQAIRCFSECLGNTYHYERTGVRVLTVCPGFTDTPMGNNVPRHIAEGIEDDMLSILANTMIQKAESVAQVILEVYENATSGTVWVSHRDLPAIQHVAKREEEYNLCTF